LVSADVAATKEFLSYFLLGCRNKKIGRAVLDEVHFLITTTHFRPLLGLIKNLRAGDVPFILMTATLPPAATEKLLEEVHFMPSSTRLIRAPTHRPEIVYTHFQLTGVNSDQYIEYLSRNGERKNMVDYINNILMASDPEARALVFCLTVMDADFIARELQCRSHHAKLTKGERNLILKDWKEGTYRVLATTSALAAGLDYPNVILVAHYGKPRNIIDYAQESGRGGRMLPQAYSTVFSDPSRRNLPLDTSQTNLGVNDMTTWTTTDQCRRMILGGSLDGIPKTCFSLATVTLCDLCELKVPARVSLSHHTVISNIDILLIRKERPPGS
jgi:superfamily II DNA helicase RecQ